MPAKKFMLLHVWAIIWLLTRKNGSWVLLSWVSLATVPLYGCFTVELWTIESIKFTKGHWIVYRESKSSFETLLERDHSFTIHHRNIQKLAVELYKVAYGISPKIMRLVFPTRPEIKYPWENIFQTFNVRAVAWGTESLSHLGPKIWKLIPLKLKKLSSLYKFKIAIRDWKPSNCPCRLCKVYIPSLGFVNVAN